MSLWSCGSPALSVLSSIGAAELSSTIYKYSAYPADNDDATLSGYARKLG